MSDNKNKPPKAALVKSNAGKVTRIEPAPLAPKPGVFDRLSQLLYSPHRDKKRTDALTEVVKAHTELGKASIDLERTKERFLDLDTILATDQEQRDSSYLEALRTRLQLKNEVDDIIAERGNKERVSKRREEVLREEQELELQERMAAIQAKRRRLQEAQEREKKEQQPRSIASELRAAVAKDTELDAASAQVLAEERRSCEEKVRRGEMTQDEMTHHLAVVEASLNRHVPRKQ